MSKYAVISPIGGFGNHARWLLLLDNQFKFILRTPDNTNHNFKNVQEKIKFLL